MFLKQFFILSVIIGMKTKYKIKLTEDSKKKLATGKYRVKGLGKNNEILLELKPRFRKTASQIA